tara:strand:- start:17 stop:748 length:732 start_codon:yes stop_codon:yes gene_type:complete
MIGHINTYDEAVAFINKLELPSGTKMAMLKDIKYGWTWAVCNPDLARNKKKDIPRYTIQTLNDDYIHISNQCLQEMVAHARKRVRSTDKRIRDFERGSRKHLSPARIAQTVSRRYPKKCPREQYDYAMGLQKYFQNAGYGRTEVFTQDTIIGDFDRYRATVDARESRGNQEAGRKSTDIRSEVRKEGQTATGATKLVLSETKSSGADVQPRKTGVVRLADRRDGYRSKRTVDYSGTATVDGDL